MPEQTRWSGEFSTAQTKTDHHFWQPVSLSQLGIEIGLVVSHKLRQNFLILRFFQLCDTISA